MKYLAIVLLGIGLTGCSGDYEVGVEDSEHVGYVSVAQTWREICEDRFNEYDYPDYLEREVNQAECRRSFATGEETIDIPEIPEFDGEIPK